MIKTVKEVTEYFEPIRVKTHFYSSETATFLEGFTYYSKKSRFYDFAIARNMTMEDLIKAFGKEEIYKIIYDHEILELYIS